MILALSMFETKMSNLDTGHKLHVLGGVDLVELGQDLARVRGQGDQHAQVRQRHQRHVVLGVGPGLGVSYQINCILRKNILHKTQNIMNLMYLLSLESCRMKISISHELRIVYTNYGAF